MEPDPAVEVDVAEHKRIYDRAWHARRSPEAKQRKLQLQDERRRGILLEVFKIKAQGTCVDCDEADPIVLDFDHVTGKKTMSIGDMVRCGFALSSILDEIKKCVLRCANCHRRKTARECGWLTGK